jgi:hypothetical protein
VQQQAAILSPLLLLRTGKNKELLYRTSRDPHGTPPCTTLRRL